MTDNKWRDFAACKGYPLEMFFDDYEESIDVQMTVDEMCRSCPVNVQCLEWAIENKCEYGVWGAKYFRSGMRKKRKTVLVDA